MQINCKKGQPSVEALMILGIAVIFIIPLVIIFYSSTSLRLETLNFLEAKAFAQHISDAAGEVWYQGKGARKTILVNYPNGMTGLYLSGDPIACPSINGEIICEESIKYAGRDIIITLEGESGSSAQLVAISPAPLKNNYEITGEFIYSQLLNYTKYTKSTAGGRINSGLTVLVGKNEGPYVNIVRYTPEAQDY